MKDYTMVKNAVEVAEKAYTVYKESEDLAFESKSRNILEQVCDYIQTVLENSDWCDIDCRYGDIKLSSGNKTTYLVNTGKYREEFNAQLWINSSTHGVIAVYFNKNGYFIEGSGDRAELVYLVTNWEKFKRWVDEKIDESFIKRIRQVKNNLEQLEKSNAIIDSFKL